MIVIDKLLTSGIGFVLRKVASAVDAELNDDSNLREELLGAQMRLELGEITDEEYDEVERSVMHALRERREAAEGRSGPLEAARVTVESIDAEAGDARVPDAAKAPRRKRKR